MMSRAFNFLVIVVAALSLALGGCSAGSQPEMVEVTRDRQVQPAEGARESKEKGPDGPVAGVKATPTRAVPAAAGSGWLDGDGTETAAAAAAPAGEIDFEEAETGMGVAAAEAGSRGVLAVSGHSNLTAGEVDDNARWDDYLRYLRDYQGPDVVRVDVSERHQILVVNGEGSPVLAAHISVWASGQEVMQLRTHSDGRAAFLPGALPAAGQAARYTLKITVNGAVEEIVIPAGDAQREWRVVHPAAGATAAPAKLDILFLIDATGSMGDEIQQLKDNIHAIAAQIAALPSRPDVRFAMTVYRDRGDAFVARTVDFTPDVAFFARALAEIEAGGGGDYAEDLNEALYRAIHVPGWRVEDTVSLIFLVADAPPHLDYADQEANYAAQMLEAAGRGFKIFPIASSGLDEQGEYIFRQLAQVSGGRFIFLTYGPAGPGTTGAETEHQVADYSVAALDKLIVRIVATELAPWRPDSNP